MIFEKSVDIPVSMEEAWAFMMDIPAVSRCVPGVVSMEAVDQDAYTGIMNVKVGAIRISFRGRLDVIARDAAARRAALRVQGDDKRIGAAMRATVEMSLEPRSMNAVALHVRSEAAVLGKLGELGQAVMLRKADQIVTEFAQNMAHALGGGSGTMAEVTVPATRTGRVPNRFTRWLWSVLRRQRARLPKS